MSKLNQLLQREPTAVGTLVGSVVPALVLLGLVHLDDKAIAGLVVAINALVGFLVRLAVMPTGNQTPGTVAAPPQPGDQPIPAPSGASG